MKMFAAAIGFLIHLQSFAQNGDVIIGKWLKTPKEDMIIEVYKTANDYAAKISWTKTADPNRPIGYVLLDQLTYDKKEESWENGKIHVPGSGKVYSAAAELERDGKLKVLGYIGFKMLGKTKYFRKVE